MQDAPKVKEIHLVATSLLRLLLELDKVERCELAKHKSQTLQKRLNGLMWREVNGADPSTLTHECLMLTSETFILAKIYPTL